MRLEGSCIHSLTVCKFKAHKRCAVRATNNCKWTTLASIGKDIIEDEDGVRKGALVKLLWLSSPSVLFLEVLSCSHSAFGGSLWAFVLPGSVQSL